MNDRERARPPPPPRDDGQTVSPERCSKSLSSATKRSNSSRAGTDVNLSPPHRNQTDQDRHLTAAFEGRPRCTRSAERERERDGRGS
ncbi:hypothetical protein DNTS_034228 [Danionella cerebrum]|uniref:Uncharacterized protein n=1 Tax=Danionella cerebrum TaxID=2873325 RepID=A0A553QIY8_9TELE|nr:hypothetical protein DNTS_034228 [Danionella translucida]